MNPTVAIIGTPDDDKSVDYLNNALHARDIATEICPVTQPREILRWAMDLSPDNYRLCIFVDTEGRLTASTTTALDPEITALVWCPEPPAPQRLVTVLSDTAALLCFAHDPLVIAGLAKNLCAPGLRKGGSSNELLPPRGANIQNIIHPEKVEAPSNEDSAADHELYKKLEAMMAEPVKEYYKPEPVEIQQAGLDFSMPLRKLMDAGRKLAYNRSHAEVLGAHYLASLEEPYLSAFTRTGLDLQLVKDYLSGLDSGEEITAEPVISDEVFQAVSEGKRRARASKGSCVRVADFLHGLLSQPDGSVADILKDGGLEAEDLKDVIAPLDSLNETCGNPFFQPSSLDQASFYQFDPTEVKQIEKRLKDLPGFKKAAARVAEARGKQEAATGDKPAVAQPVVPSGPIAPAVPPDKPDFLKVSGEFPDVDVIEHVADRLLEGHIVAFPSDIMFAVAVDATNAAAVAMLREAAGLPDDKPLSIMINSTSQLKHLARADLDELEPLFDELWPGPLTLVFKSAGATGRHVASKGTIAVRQPADNISLAVLSMLGRPLAVTSWDRTEGDLTGHAAAVVSSGARPVEAITTIVDLTAEPWQVLREGVVPGQAVLSFYKD